MVAVPKPEIGLALIKLVCETADRLSSGFPNYPVRVDGEQQVESDDDYLYVTVEVASMLDQDRKPRELRIATAALPEDPRALLAGGLQQERGPGGDVHRVQLTPTDQLRDRLREALLRFIYRGHNLAYVDAHAVDSDRAFLTAEEALDSATPHPNGTRRASGSRRGSEATYEAVRSASGDLSVCLKRPDGSHAPVALGEPLLGVVWQPETFSRIDRIG